MRSRLTRKCSCLRNIPNSERQPLIAVKRDNIQHIDYCCCPVAETVCCHPPDILLIIWMKWVVGEGQGGGRGEWGGQGSERGEGRGGGQGGGHGSGREKLTSWILPASPWSSGCSESWFLPRLTFQPPSLHRPCGNSLQCNINAVERTIMITNGM